MQGSATERRDKRSCIVCRGKGPFRRIYRDEGFTLVGCPDCGLVFQDPQSSDDALRRTYYHDPEWTRAQLGPMREVLVERARSQAAFLTRAGVQADGRRLLDVGCAAGTFMEIAEQVGWGTMGVEIGETTAQAARSKGLDVHTGTLQDCLPSLAPGSFELVTFWDVLEHVRDPREELIAARDLLAPGGMIAATMPNVSGLYPKVTYRLFARTTGRWEYPEPVHMYDFDPRTIARLLQDAGYRDIHVETFSTPFSYYRTTTLSVAALGGGLRGRALRAGFELLHAALYPVARTSDRGNSQFVLATKA